jgi:hypothetical protein
MSGGGFKFDFSPSLHTSTTVNSDDHSPPLTSAAADHAATAAGDALIQKILDRASRSSCTIVNASSKSFSTDATNRVMDASDSDGTSTSAVPTPTTPLEPHLRFSRHESVELFPKTTNPMRYVVPKHTLSDDTTDLIPGVYEGGLKVWECSVDLCRFLAEVIDSVTTTDTAMDISTTNDTKTSNADLEFVKDALMRSLDQNGSTMELGCGHGLPGCLILRENIRRSLLKNDNPTSNNAVVFFTDFNDFVLHHATIPNAQLNVSGLRGENGVSLDEYGTSQALLARSVFAGGDWMGLSYKLSTGSLYLTTGTANQRFDLILASETTYTLESCQDTAFLMMQHLKISTGVGLVATKRFYFGVGGGTDVFSEVAKTLNASDLEPYVGLQLVVRTIKSYDTGNANIRDLLEVRCLRKEE